MSEFTRKLAMDVLLDGLLEETSKETFDAQAVAYLIKGLCQFDQRLLDDTRTHEIANHPKVRDKLAKLVGVTRS